MKLLGFEIPKGQRLWFWNAGGEVGTLLFAKDEDEAYAKCIQSRIDSDPAKSLENARRWFAHHDELSEITADYTGTAYQGPLPDED